ncbi:hypothetical protein BSL78_08541 [Apostichopus japonicus]|uniref:ZP domain-containing protein n=1 Tax=Stichopus japonicus TaxID=307972 RepID=A0A2G8L2U1_STIJA|nr:hypothetical protein BSL78_08541 [Apostichopus japonicus]
MYQTLPPDNSFKQIVSWLPRCGINDAAVRVLIPKSRTQADFELTTFRFATQLGQAVSQISCICQYSLFRIMYLLYLLLNVRFGFLICEVVVCDEDFECIRGCEVSRSRRAAAQSQKVTRVTQGPFILPTEDEEIIQTRSAEPYRDDGGMTLSGSVLSVIFIVVMVTIGVALIVVGRGLKRPSSPVYTPVDVKPS